MALTIRIHTGGVTQAQIQTDVHTKTADQISLDRGIRFTISEIRGASDALIQSGLGLITLEDTTLLEVVNAVTITGMDMDIIDQENASPTKILTNAGGYAH
jgi:hypothetical protein